MSAVSGLQEWSLISKSHLYIEIQSKKERSADVKPPAHRKKGDGCGVWVCVYIAQPRQSGSGETAPQHRALGQRPRAPGRGDCSSGSSATQLVWSFPAQLSCRCSGDGTAPQIISVGSLSSPLVMTVQGRSEWPSSQAHTVAGVILTT